MVKGGKVFILFYIVRSSNSWFALAHGFQARGIVRPWLVQLPGHGTNSPGITNNEWNTKSLFVCFVHNSHNHMVFIEQL